jgi:hypothetical protein
MRMPLLLVLAMESLLLIVAGADCAAPRCIVDSDCGADHCNADGRCVACLDNDDCADDAACCNGQCRSESVEELCGCEAAIDGTGPTSCADTPCVVKSGVRANRATVAEGVCACPCDPAQGGTLCVADEAAANGFSCSCDRTDPVGTCEGPALDATGIPHRPADTCSPQSSCVCFAAQAVCTGSADCTAAGCVDLVHDDVNCGVAGRICTDENTGTAEGRCVAGGCTCDAATDCIGTGLNVDTCVFVDASSQCVCGGYRSGDQPSACPMGLACVDDGCVFEGAAYATREALVEVLLAR